MQRDPRDRVSPRMPQPPTSAPPLVSRPLYQAVCFAASSWTIHPGAPLTVDVGVTVACLKAGDPTLGLSPVEYHDPFPGAWSTPRTSDSPNEVHHPIVKLGLERRVDP